MPRGAAAANDDRQVGEEPLAGRPRGGAKTVTISYLVYGREMSVRTNWIDGGFAMLNGAPTFISMVGGTARPHEVRIELARGLEELADAARARIRRRNTFRAEDYDTLVDSPIVLGNPVVKPFTVAGKRHNLVLEGDPAFFDADRAAVDVQKIVEAARHRDGRQVRLPALLLPQHRHRHRRRRARAQEQLPR